MDFYVTQVNRMFNLTQPKYWNGDPRVKDWPLMQGPDLMASLVVLYLFAVIFGPKFMASYKPVNVKWLMIVYNLAMVGLSMYMTIEFIAIAVQQRYGFLCQGPDYSPTPIGYREASVMWWYFISKIMEFSDTFFFIVRKKNNQITFLHLYHHISTTVICWYFTKYFPGGEVFYADAFNTLVHVFMYTYYGLTALGPQVQKYLWWKKYITKFQMTQFVCVNTRWMLGILLVPRCAFPRWLSMCAFVYYLSLYLLFSNFYKHAYQAQQERKQASVSENVHMNGKTEHND